MNPQKIGRSIAFLRKKYGLTQLDLATRLGVTDKAVSRWERGMGTPDISLLVKLSIVLDIDVETLLEGNVAGIEPEWRGVLILKYAPGISPLDQICGKRIVYLQLCYFLLVGITDILLIGSKKNIRQVREEVGDSGRYGLRLKYYDAADTDQSGLLSSERLREWNANSGIMLIDGFELIYGKDFTKYLRRAMNGTKEPVNVIDFEKNPTSLHFFPHGWASGGVSCPAQGGSAKANTCLERGMLVLPVRNTADLLDAGCFVRALEAHQKEQVLDIGQIAVQRHIRTDPKK